MDRADRAGIGVAVAGHVVLFGALSLGVANFAPPPEPALPPAMAVEFVETMALAPAAEPVADQPAAEAPEIGAVEEPEPAPAPEVTPAPVPEPVVVAPPPPAPRPEPVRAEPVRRAVPKPVPKPAPKPAPVKVAAKPQPAKPAPAKPTPAKPTKPAPVKTAAKAAPVKNASARIAPAKTATAKPTAPASGKGEKTAARAPRLGKDFLAGLKDPALRQAAPAPAAAAPVMSADAMAGIQAAIKRQIQPCANRNVDPGPGANRITVKLNIRLNKDGSLAGPPRVVSTSGVNAENSRYEKRVSDLAVAAYKGCAPMRGLPVDLYRTAKGGWSNVNMNYKLPG